MEKESIYIVGVLGYENRAVAEAALKAEEAANGGLAEFFAAPPDPAEIETAKIVETCAGKDEFGRATYRLDNGMIAIGLPDRPFESYIGTESAPESMYCGAEYYITFPPRS